MPHAYLFNTIAKLSLHCDMWHLKLACGAACRLFELEPSQIAPPNFISRSATGHIETVSAHTLSSTEQEIFSLSIFFS